MKLVEIIESANDQLRDEALVEACGQLSDEGLLEACDELEHYWQSEENLYKKVRALFFLHALHRYILPGRGLCPQSNPVPEKSVRYLYDRRYEHAIRETLNRIPEPRRCDTHVSCLSAAYRGLALQCLADQVRSCVRNVAGNRWMFRTGHPEEVPLRVRKELLTPNNGRKSCLVERTAVRMDLSHSAWSDIFFLAMDRPEFAKVLNVSINLCRNGDVEGPQPPVEAWFRVIEEPVIRLVSVDLEASAEIDNLPEIFDYGRDHLGLLKAALVASGIIPPGLEGCRRELHEVLEQLVGKGRGFEVVSSVNNIPKGSRLAVSTNLMAALIAVCMRATSQIQRLEGPLEEHERSMLAARSILGEWLGGSGGGWQDSGGVWPGIKRIEGVLASEGESEYGISRGRLLPKHKVLDTDEASDEARAKLSEALILVHGGLAQNVGPILEMVTERYLLRDSECWEARAEALRLTDEIEAALRDGNMRELGRLTTEIFEGPLKTIIPWASNPFTEALMSETKEALGEDYWGFWMLGGMSGGGMGLIVNPKAREKAVEAIDNILKSLKGRFDTGLPFAIDPVIYDFEVNEAGSFASFGEQAFPGSYYRLRLPSILRKAPSARLPEDNQDLAAIRDTIDKTPDMGSEYLDSIIENQSGERYIQDAETDHDLDQLLLTHGFDREAHEQIRADLQSGKIGLKQNRLSPGTRIQDVAYSDLVRPNTNQDHIDLGNKALANGEVAQVTLAAGAGSRWTQGAGVVKALHPFIKLSGNYRNFIDIHLAKSRKDGELAGVEIPHVFTTSYLTNKPIQEWFERRTEVDHKRVSLSMGGTVGLRFVPTLRDLEFAWDETPQPRLDAQAEKMRASVRSALKRWAKNTGEASDYRDNNPLQCLHPVGHWYEVPGLLLNGTLKALLQDRPQLRTLLLHNIDTLGACFDPELLGIHLASKNTLNFEVISRRVDDVGGGLARVNEQLKLMEGMAMPSESDEYKLSYYNTLTTWIDIDGLLSAFGLDRKSLNDGQKVARAIREFSKKLPVYMTLKEVKKRWGRGQEDIFPVLQFERLWGDMSGIDTVPTGYFLIDRFRGQQLKDAAQLDGWSRDGSREHVEGLCWFG